MYSPTLSSYPTLPFYFGFSGFGAGTFRGCHAGNLGSFKTVVFSTITSPLLVQLEHDEVIAIIRRRAG